MQTESVDPSVSRTPLPLDADDVATACVLCSHNCGLRVDVRGGEITEVRARRAQSRSPRATSATRRSASRPTSSTRSARSIRCAGAPDGTLRAHLAGTRRSPRSPRSCATIRDRHSPRAIALVGIGGQGNHMDGAYGVGFLRSLGSRRWFNAFAQEKTQHNLLDQWMFDASPAAFFHPDAEHTPVPAGAWGRTRKISNRGHNATDTLKRFVDEPGRTLVVVDPRETETTRGAQRHLRVRPGTDVYLLLALAAVIVREAWSTSSSSPSARRGFETAARGARRRSTSPRWRAAAGSTSTRSRRRRAASRAPNRRRSSSTSASSRRRSRPSTPG